jgi:hypothetical protein
MATVTKLQVLVTPRHGALLHTVNCGMFDKQTQWHLLASRGDTL